ncbi:hypothetical protein ACN2AU_09125 [Aerococcus viridans]
MTIRNLTANEAQVKYFGIESWIDDIEMTEYKSLYAVYNDEIAEGMQIGTMTINHKNNTIEIEQEII